MCRWFDSSYRYQKVMESNAGGMVRRLALKTRFSEMGWGSTPLLSASYALVSLVVEVRSCKAGVLVRFRPGAPINATLADVVIAAV